MNVFHLFGDSRTIQNQCKKAKTSSCILHHQQLSHHFNTANVWISSTAVERRPGDFKETPVDPPKTILTKPQIHHFWFRSKSIIFHDFAHIFINNESNSNFFDHFFPDWEFLSGLVVNTSSSSRSILVGIAVLRKDLCWDPSVPKPAKWR